MSTPVAWRRLEQGWGALWLQIHRSGSLWRVLLEEDGGANAQALFQGAGPARDICRVANQALAQCRTGGWQVVAGSGRGDFSPFEVGGLHDLPLQPARPLADVLFA